MTAKAGSAYVDFHGDFSGLQKEVSAQLAPLTGKFGKLGKAAGIGLAGLAVGAVGAGKALYDIGATFDKASDTIRTETGATGKRLEGLKADFKAVYADVPGDASEVASAVGQLNQRLGVSGKPLQKLSKQVLELSRITGGDLNEIVESSTRLFGDWSVKVGQQPKVMDKLFRLTQMTGISFEDLNRLMVQFGSPLRQLGMSFDESAAMFARFEKEGVNMQTLLPGLRMGLKNIALPSDELAGIFQRLGVTAKEPHDALMQIFQTISDPKVKAADKTLLASQVFGGRAWADMKAAIEEGRFSFDELIGGMNKGKGTIEGTAKGTNDLGENMRILGHKIQVFLEPLGTKVFDLINKGVVKLTTADFSSVITSLRRFWDAAGLVRTVFSTLGHIIAANLGGIADIFRGQFQMVRGIIKVFAGVFSGDWGKAWDGVKDIFRGGARFILGLLKTMTAPIRGVAKQFGVSFGGAWNKIKSVFSDGVGAIRGFIQMILDIINVIPGVNIQLGGGGGGVQTTKHKGSGGGVVSGKGFAVGGKVTRPMAIVGEEAPRHPEYVLATNPAYRGRNVGLWMAAGRELGVPGFAFGGQRGGKSVVEQATGTIGDIVGRLPSPNDLPVWLRSLGSLIVREITKFARDKIGDAGKNLGEKALGLGKSVVPGVFMGGLLPGFAQGGVPRPRHGSHWLKVLTERSQQGGRVSLDEAATLYWQAGLSEADASNLSRVVPPESGGNTRAVSSAGAKGFSQILGSVFPGNLFNPIINAINAKMKYEDGGLEPWSPSRSGWVATGGQILKNLVGGKQRRSTKGQATKGAKKLGLKPELQKRINTQSALSDLYEEYATRANTLEGMVVGADEITWLQRELEALFRLRELLITAVEQLQAALTELSKIPDHTMATGMGGAKGAAAAAASGGGSFFDRVKAFTDEVPLGHFLQQQGYQVGEHPQFGGVAPGVHDPGGYHPQGRAIDVNHGGNEAGWLDKLFAPLKQNSHVVELLWRVKDHFDHLHVAFAQGGIMDFFKKGGGKGKKPKGGVAGQTAEAIKKQREALTSKLSEVTDSLSEVEGLGPYAGKHLSGLPEVGALGGRIFDVQTALRDVGGKQPQITGLSAESLKEILALSGLGVKFNPAQFAALGLPSFDGGGVIPGPMGAPQPVIAHGKEVVLTPEQAAALGVGGGTIVIVEDDAIDRTKIRQISRDEMTADQRAKAQAYRAGVKP